MAEVANCLMRRCWFNNMWAAKFFLLCAIWKRTFFIHIFINIRLCLFYYCFILEILRTNFFMRFAEVARWHQGAAVLLYGFDGQGRFS